MNTNSFVINKLKSNNTISQLLSYMKDNGGCYVAGGALTCIASGKHDEINDYDIYFPTKESAVEAIRYMKDHDPHVTFTSDKSISYKINDVDIQFIYTDFYPKPEDIFKHFDFTINMIAYDCRDETLTFDENFWLHLSQRYLSINTQTKFPIITNLRIDKYKQRGFKTSRNQMIKLSLAISNLKIDTWEEAKAQIGNTYGLTLADFNDVKGTPFSLEALFERIDSVSNEIDPLNIPMQENYLYPHNAVDFLLLGEPVEYININGNKHFTDINTLDCEIGIEELVERGLLEYKESSLKDWLQGKTYYTVYEGSEEALKESFKSTWNKPKIYTKEDLDFTYASSTSNIYRVTFKPDDVVKLNKQSVEIKYSSDIEVTYICKVFDKDLFKSGNPFIARKIAKVEGDSFSFNGHAFDRDGDAKRWRIKVIKEYRSEHIEKFVVKTGGGVSYAKNTFKGVILEGGEDIKAEELLYHMDSYNLCFGGSITISKDGTFSGSYNTD